MNLIELDENIRGLIDKYLLLCSEKYPDYKITDLSSTVSKVRNIYYDYLFKSRAILIRKDINFINDFIEEEVDRYKIALIDEINILLFINRNN